MTFNRVKERLIDGHRRNCSNFGTCGNCRNCKKCRNCRNGVFHFDFFRPRPWRFGRPALLLFAVFLMVRFCSATAEALAASPTAEERVLGIEVVKSRGDDFVQYPSHLHIFFKPWESKDGFLPPTAWWLRHLPHPMTISQNEPGRFSFPLVRANRPCALSQSR